MVNVHSYQNLISYELFIKVSSVVLLISHRADRRVITARVQRMTGGYVFTRIYLLTRVGTPIWPMRGVLKSFLMGVPSSFLTGGTPILPDWGVPHLANGSIPPPSRLEGVPPLLHQKTEQQSEHLLRGGRYASCLHPRGLSCCICNKDFFNTI